MKINVSQYNNIIIGIRLGQQLMKIYNIIQATVLKLLI